MAMQLWNGVNVFKKEMKLESVLYLGGTEMCNPVPRRYCFDEKPEKVIPRSFTRKTSL